MEKGKTCWDIFQLYPQFIPAFRVIFEMSPTKEDIYAIFPLLNKLTAILYQNNDVFQHVDSLRLHLLIHKGKSFDSMPPGSESLKLRGSSGQIIPMNSFIIFIIWICRHQNLNN